MESVQLATRQGSFWASASGTKGTNT